jgi:small conductance mechanosensitive channel
VTPYAAMASLVQIPQADDTTTSAAADSLSTSLDRIGEQVTATGRLILQGEWSAVLDRALAGSADLAVSLLPSLLSALFVGVFFYGLYLVVMRVVRGFLRRSSRVDVGLERIVTKTLRVVGWTFIALLVLSQLGINLSALVAGLGIAGLAVGFAAKDSLENFISGITILLDRPFSIGDWITVGDHYGRVTNITLRSTRLRTLNGETVVFPSVQMVTQAVINHTSGSALRVDIPFSIAYKEDIDSAREVVVGVVDSVRDRLDGNREHRVVTTRLADSGVEMELQVFLEDPGDAVPIRFELTESVRKALGDADIEIPFPHLQLFVEGGEGLERVALAASSDEGRGGADDSRGELLP